MSSFFTIPSAAKKRKRPEGSENPKKRFAPSKSKNNPRESKPARTPRKPQRDESISGSENEDGSDRGDEEEYQGSSDAASSSGSEEGDDAEETAAERRLRLAERYLENIREEVDEHGFDAEEIDRDLIAERLQEDAAESKGRMYRKLALDLAFEDASYSGFRNDSDIITSVATCPPYAYTVSKDMFLIKWQIQELPANQFPQKKKKSKKTASSTPPKTNTTGIFAASQDGKFVVTGGRDRRMIVWDAATLKPLRVFTQHRDAVTGLAFRRGTNQLYSSSKDRTIKVWSLDELAYIETLFGHQDEVVDIAALAQERCISVGARDRTARLWKVVEETQLVFRGGGGEKKSRSGPRVLEGSMDRVAMIDEETFVTGGDNGCISLWVIHKKKPIFTLPQAHGMDPALQPDEASAEVKPSDDIVPAPQPRWITALVTIPYSDVILSGSWDGQLRAWRLSDDKKKLEPLGGVGSNFGTQVNGQELKNGHANEKPVVKGVINDISVFERGDRGKDGACVVVAVGKELRTGRWYRLKEGAKNGAVVFEIPRIPKSNGVVADEKDE
ncbi:WD40 repeat-like protein [Glarea lozoyensis ATCC 20868]|uniref:WD40 repeat-like protein n=1 Tax=Glarea lozoyensis (strain ATCC 20868 / MF5171) TaxID=1116229 RepID=S3D6Z6_GLAL2|nr:WD40 repeat-like protein [Glarea lozoyensis ATCC 20868]EPE32909.1 WD40 repeat-like protein [Glarea lozoyensis ATCC 20868]